MKIYALYYKDTFVVAFLNREDCVEYGMKYYEGTEWDCSIIERWLYEKPFSQPITPIPHSPYMPYKQPKEINIPPWTWTCTDGPRAEFIPVEGTNISLSTDTSQIKTNE
jgi:hypothetical protein